MSPKGCPVQVLSHVKDVRIGGSVGLLVQAQISQVVGWISVKLYSHVSQRMNLSPFTDPMTFPPVSPAVQSAGFICQIPPPPPKKRLMLN